MRFCRVLGGSIWRPSYNGQRRSLEREIEVTMELKKRFNEHVQRVGNVGQVVLR